MRSGFKSANRGPISPRCQSGPATANVLSTARTSAIFVIDARIVRRFILAKLQGSGAMPSLHQRLLRHPLLRLEYVAVQDRCDTQVRDIDELCDVEIDGYAHQYVGLLAAKTLCFHQKVDHVEGGISCCQTDILREVCQRSDFLTTKVGVEHRQFALRLERKPRDGIKTPRGETL